MSIANAAMMALGVAGNREVTVPAWVEAPPVGSFDPAPGAPRTLLLAVLGAGGLLVTVITLADVLVRRTDLGRRRALGATRGVIVALVVLRTVAPALCGAAIGTGLGIYLTARLGAAPPWEFTCGTVLLALLAAATAAVPPALYAATRDPVRVLRTP